jgi:DNA-binding MarR family transcriptional regulator
VTWRHLRSSAILFLACSGVTAINSEDLGPLSLGITGSAPSEPTRNPTAILRPSEVQRLILAIADHPHSRAEVETAIADQFFTVDDMVAVGLLREESGDYWIDFNLLRVEDQQRILEVSENLGRSLAGAFLDRREEFEAIARGHEQPGHLSAEFLYHVLGCFSLDWDGLDLTEERGWRLGAQRVIDGREFTPWAKERGAEVSLKGLYWGSHNNSVGGTTLTTFGDHHSLPRFGLPDLLWSNATSFRGFEEPEEAETAAQMLAAYEQDVSADVARVMMELGKEALSSGAICERTGIPKSKLDRILAFLEAAEYVESRGEDWQAKVLVLRSEDAEKVEAVVAKGREIMLEWHEANYDGLREGLSDLTPIRNGVPFERVYTEIWHFLFGFANRTLVEEGLFADPYGQDRRYQGFLPVVWADGLAHAP